MNIERLAELMAEAEDIVHMALASAEVGIWCWNPDTNVLVWNLEMHRLFGTSRDLFSGKVDDFFNCLVDEERERVKHALGECIKTGDTYDIVYEIKTVPGRFIRGRGKYYKTTSHRPSKFVGVCIEAHGLD